MSSDIILFMYLCILSLCGKETPSIQEFRVRRYLCTANSGLHKTGHFIGFDLKPLYQDIVGTGDGLDMQMLRQRCKALDKKAQEPLEGDTHRATNAP